MDKSLAFARNLKKYKQKTVEHESDSDTNCKWYTLNGF